jgi:aminoglycoside phosphotransferase family enzyme/predicted kinase
VSTLPARVRPFADPSFYAHRPAAVELIETHISWVFLAGEYVYKIKKPVSFGFLDFRTLTRRRHFCREEVRLNQRLAPNAYLDVVGVTRAGGAYRLGGRGRAHEVAVWMRRLPADRMLDRLVEAEQADHRLMEDIGRTIADFHSRAATGPAIARFGRVEAIRRNLEQNLAQTGHFPPEVLPRETRVAVPAFLRQMLRGRGRRFAERVRAGRIRDCHGDLQAQHVCCTDPIQVFDCIEFNHRFRYGDTAGEIAFLAMDLDVLGRPDLALDFVNAYLDATGDYGAVPLLDFYRAYRAWIRGKVYGLQAVDPARADHAALVAGARAYFDLASSYVQPRATPSVVVMTGLSASGKSTVAREISHAARAVVVRTDAVRKQLAGVPWHQRHSGRVGEGLYTPEMTKRTYRACLHLAGGLLEAGWSVILDGVFGRRAEREAARALAQRRGVAFRVVWCDAPEQVLRDRLRARMASGRDLSDAREGVLDLQLRHYELPVGEPDVERRAWTA